MVITNLSVRMSCGRNQRTSMVPSAQLRRAIRTPRCWNVTAKPYDKYKKTFNMLQLKPTQHKVLTQEHYAKLVLGSDLHPLSQHLYTFILTPHCGPSLTSDQSHSSTYFLSSQCCCSRTSTPFPDRHLAATQSTYTYASALFTRLTVRCMTRKTSIYTMNIPVPVLVLVLQLDLALLTISDLIFAQYNPAHSGAVCYSSRPNVTCPASTAPLTTSISISVRNSEHCF